MNLNATLSEREEQVGKFLAWGYMKKEIAGALNLSEHTVVNHARSIYEKTEVSSLGQFAAWWFVVKHGVSMAAKPLLSILFIFLICVNEFNDDDNKMVRASRVKVRSVKVSKGRRRNENEENTIELV